mgnify:CR=1 FL=1|jgi:outer membrane murein-binding lipoprotein Lpp
MKRIILLLLLFGFALSNLSANSEFKLKLEVSLVNHEYATGVRVVVQEKGTEVKPETLDSDGKSKLSLDEGRLYDVWVNKSGFLSQVIHNVHAEGTGKFEITLYKETSKLKSNPVAYEGVNRIFDGVKEMTIPAEYLADNVLVVKEEAMTKDEVTYLKTVHKIGKVQVKAQKKIDKLNSKRAHLEEDMSENASDFAAGKVDQTTADEKKLKIQEKIVKTQHALDKLVY